jgi:chromate transporter
MSDFEAQTSTTATRAASLKELALLFLKLGTIAFGGPAAHIAMMEDEVVRRRRWLTREKFLDLLGMTNLIPGPNSTELAIHLGYTQRGWAGLLVAGSCFIFPAAIIVGTLAWAYVRFGTLPQASGLLYGVKPVVIAVVLQALWKLARTAAKTKFLALIGLVAVLLGFLGINELVVLFGAGVIVGIRQWIENRRQRGRKPPSGLLAAMPILPLAQMAATTATTAPPTVGLLPLFLFFLKVGSVLFGSGYVLLAFLRADLVERWGWLSDAQLIDAIAIGQVTPGPVFTTATFIGYILAGPLGAVVGTVGIFLPAFFFVALSGPLVPRLRQSQIAGAFLDGLNVASLALMAVVTWYLARAALIDWITVGLVIASAILLIRFRVNSVWLVLGGAIIGLTVFSSGLVK